MNILLTISLFAFNLPGNLPRVSSYISNFGPRVYPRGSLVIALVRGPSVDSSVDPLVCPSLNFSETAIRIFLIFCMKLGHHKAEEN